MELSPRTGPDGPGATATAAPGETAGPGLAPTGATRSKGGRRLPVIIALLVIVGIAGFVIVNALGNATMFFYNADEAMAKQDQLGTSRFRLQGTVVPGTVQRTDDGVTFSVTFNGVEVPVRHMGDPPELFQQDIPVVLEGHFAPSGTAVAGEQAAASAGAPLFLSDRMLVKHSEQYDAKNGDRNKEAVDGGQVSTTTVGGSGQAGTP